MASFGGEEFRKKIDKEQWRRREKETTLSSGIGRNELHWGSCLGVGICLRAVAFSQIIVCEDIRPPHHAPD